MARAAGLTLTSSGGSENKDNHRATCEAVLFKIETDVKDVSPNIKM